MIYLCVRLSLYEFIEVVKKNNEMHENLHNDMLMLYLGKNMQNINA